MQQRGSVLAFHSRILAALLALAGTDKKGNLTVGKVHIWESMSETWVEITPSSITPNPGNDPVITLPSGVRQGDKFKIAWTSDSPDGGVEKTTYTS